MFTKPYETSNDVVWTEWLGGSIAMEGRGLIYFSQWLVINTNQNWIQTHRNCIFLCVMKLKRDAIVNCSRRWSYWYCNINYIIRHTRLSLMLSKIHRYKFIDCCRWLTKKKNCFLSSSKFAPLLNGMTPNNRVDRIDITNIELCRLIHSIKASIWTRRFKSFDLSLNELIINNN